ncbi:hypothetical protein B566_EDAN001114, partial [Ephemera danica]
TGHEINVSISQSTRGPWKALQINGPQDREGKYSEHRTVHVTCLHRNSRKFNSSISIEILDQNDNAPTVQTPEIHVAIKSSILKSYVPDIGNLLFHIMFLDDAILPDSYKAILTLDDTSLVPGIAEKFVKPQITLILEPKNKKTAVGNIAFPTTDIRISRNAALFERITEPLNKVQEDSLLIFSLDQAFNVFDITHRTGIIYVSNSAELHASTWNETEITILWKTENTTTDYFNTTLKLKISHEKVSCMLAAREEGSMCARFKDSSTCTSNCGFSSSSFCQWRYLTKDNSITNCTKHYATCSPNNKTCPDGVCDELEMKDYDICPQDCTGKP